MGDNLKEFSNQEKAMVIIALRDKYPVKRILEVFDMAKSSYCYQQKQIKKENKIVKIKEQIKMDLGNMLIKIGYLNGIILCFIAC